MPFSASPTDEATGHRNCGGSTASLAVSGLKTTGGLDFVLDCDQRRGDAAWSSVFATTRAIGWPA